MGKDPRKMSDEEVEKFLDLDNCPDALRTSPSVLKEIVGAGRRVLLVGGIPPLEYQGMGGSGVVFCDQQGKAYKAARLGIAEESIKEEADWLRVASSIPHVALHVARFIDYHPKEHVIERECVRWAKPGRPRKQDRWELHKTFYDAMVPYGFGQPEFKDDSFVYARGRGWVLVDAGFAVHKGIRLVKKAVDLMKGGASYERPEDVAWEVRMESGSTIPPHIALKLDHRLQRMQYALEAAKRKLYPAIMDWVHRPSAGKKEVLDAYASLTKEEKLAYDLDVKRSFLQVHGADRAIFYRYRKNPADMGGRSLSSRKPQAPHEAWIVRRDDVLCHYGQVDMPLASKAFGHEKEIILKADAKPARTKES